MKIAAVVILYNPDEFAIKNIETYYEYIDKVYVFDNSEKNSSIEAAFLNYPKITYYYDSENEGISKRLNRACEIAIENNFDWLLTMDQDTSFIAGSIQNYLNCFHAHTGKENVAMFGTKFNRKINWNSSWCEAEDVDDLITSGMLLNLSLFKKIGHFDEALFIDSIDHEYCIRAKIEGYSIIQFSNINIIHEIGKEIFSSSIKTFYFIKKKKAVHSPLRYYYMYRNLLYLEKKYKGLNIVLVKKIRGAVISHIKRGLFYGRNTRKLLRYLIAAYIDFKKNKMGKIVREL